MLMTLGLIATSERPLNAILPGVPSVVYDPVNYASAIDRYRQMVQHGRGQVRQIQYAYDQVRHAAEQARGWTKLRFSDFQRDSRNAQRVMGAGIAVGYGNSQLLRNFQEAFPRVPRVVDGVQIPNAEQLNSLRDVSFAAVVGAQMQGQQIDVAQRALHALKNGIVNSRTERQLAQMQAGVQAFQAEQDLLARHSMLSLTNQIAIANARTAQRDMEQQIQHNQTAEQYGAWSQLIEELRRQNDRELDSLRAVGGGKPFRPRRPTRPAPPPRPWLPPVTPPGDLPELPPEVVPIPRVPGGNERDERPVGSGGEEDARRPRAVPRLQ